jgi:hypothetical protein
MERSNIGIIQAGKCILNNLAHNWTYKGCEGRKTRQREIVVGYCAIIRGSITKLKREWNSTHGKGLITGRMAFSNYS